MEVVKPDLPSSVLRFVGETSLTIPLAYNEVVAIPLTHDWGPLGSEAEGGKVVRSFAEWESLYGTGASAGRTAVVGAFRGMGLPGQGGAGGVIPFRMATGSAARAAVTLDNTAAADALTLTAKWAGTRGNDLSVVIEDDPLDAAKDRLRVRFRGGTVEQYSFTAANVADLVAQINARPSKWVTATQVATGTALAAGTFNLTGGNDGAAVTATEYAEALTALEFADFGILAPAALTSAAVKVQIATWARGMADAMRPVRVVLGGAAGESVDDAESELTTNALLRDPHVVRFAVGTWHDSVLGADLSTAELAPRIAGVLAARGTKSALTAALLADLEPVGANVPTKEELIAGRDTGLTMLTRVSHPDASLAISQGVTTFIDRATDAYPYALFSEPRLVGLFDSIVRRMTAWGYDVVIGDLPVTDDTRNLVRTELRKILDELEAEGLSEPGSGSAVVDPPDDPDLRDAIPYEFGFQPTRTANYLIGHGRVR